MVTQQVSDNDMRVGDSQKLQACGTDIYVGNGKTRIRYLSDRKFRQSNNQTFTKTSLLYQNQYGGYLLHS